MTMIVSKLVYRCGALAVYQHECEDLKLIRTVLAVGYGKYMSEEYIIINKYHETIMRKGTEGTTLVR